MNFKNKELIIFDLDGTLINSIPDLTLATNKMLANYNFPQLTIKEVTPFIGDGARTQISRALQYSMQGKEVSNELLEEALKIYFSAYLEVTCDKTYLYPHVLETLEYLNKKGYKMVICTNKPIIFVEPILNKLSIKKFFKLWIGGDSLTEKKPNPTPLIHLSDKMESSIEKCIMVGDSKNDILAAQNAGMANIGSSYGYNFNENIADYNPTIELDSFDSLKELF